MTPLIIINWNGFEDTIECISSLQEMTYDNFHVYLIDNNSDNNEGEKLQHEYKNAQNITVLLYETNLGFTKAHIKVWDDIISKLDTTYLVLLNNDTSVDANWLSELISFADKNKVDIVSSKMIDYTNRHLMDNAGHKMLNTGEIIPVGFSEPIEDYDSSFENLGACGGACLYRTSMIRQIGFFDPFFKTGYEDAEYGLRAKISGYNLQYNPDAIVYHKRGSSIKKIFNREYSILIQTSILYSYFKLVPLLNIIMSLPSIIFKAISIVIIDILFFRWNYLIIWFCAWKNIFKLRKLIINKRRLFNINLKSQLISPFEFFKKTDFFLATDIDRFIRIILLNKKSALDRY